MSQPSDDAIEYHDKHNNSITRLDSHGLTEKQASFAREVANGQTLKAAYERSYDVSNMGKASIYTEASRLIDHPAIALRVKQLMEERQKKTHAVDAMRIRQHVFDRLMVESVDDENPAAARIKALELLGKIDVVSMFKEQKGGVPDDVPDVATLQAKLEGLIAKMIDVSPVISGTKEERKT